MSQLRLYRFPRWVETPYKYVLLKRKNDASSDERAPPSENEHRLEESLSRSRRLIMEYILCNQFDLFCTFTFDKMKVRDRADFKDLSKRLRGFFNDHKKRLDPEFKYLVVPELHKDGSVHFHGVINATYGLCSRLEIDWRRPDGRLTKIKNTKGYMDWAEYSKRFGHFSCSWIRDQVGCSVYVSKYMTKDIADWFQKNDKMVLHSQGLRRPELVYLEDTATSWSIPGGAREDDKDYEFCVIAMRDMYDAAEHYIDWVDEFTLHSGDVIRAEDWWRHEEWRKLPGPFDDFEQTTLFALAVSDAYARRRK